MAAAKKSKNKSTAKPSRTTKKIVVKKAKAAAKKVTKKIAKKVTSKAVKKGAAKVAKKAVARKTVAKKTVLKKATAFVKKTAKKITKVEKVAVKKILKTFENKPAAKLSAKTVKNSSAPKVAKRSVFVPLETSQPVEVKSSEPVVEVPGLAVGTVAPHFDMPATVLGRVSTESLKGKPYVLYFYPKDDTPGCTTEACGFRDALPALGLLDATVIGVSKDNLASHEHFSEKFQLTFPLAYDDSDVSERFGVWVSKSMYGRTYMGIERTTFLVDGTGTIRAVWRKVNVAGHVEEVEKEIKSL